MNQSTRQDDIIVWQTSEEGVAEPALWIEPFDNNICVNQEDRFININYETVPELIKLLKSIKRPS